MMAEPLPKIWVCHRYHMTKPSISCEYVLITYIGPTGIITPPTNMSTVSNQTILNWVWPEAQSHQWIVKFGADS